MSTAIGARGTQHRGLEMKTQTRVLAAVLGFSACLYQVSAFAAGNQASSTELAANKHSPPEVFPSEIYDPFGLVSRSRHGQLVTLAAGFSFTEGPAADRHGNV